MPDLGSSSVRAGAITRAYMTESIPSNSQPSQADQKPRICWRVRLVMGRKKQLVSYERETGARDNSTRVSRSHLSLHSHTLLLKSCWFGQKVLLNLPQRRSRQCFYENEPSRNFEARELIPTHLFELRHLQPVLGDDVRDGYFPPHRIGEPDHGCFAHLRVLEQQLFDLPRIDVESAGDDEIALPPAQRVVAVLRTDSDVAGLEPAVVKRRDGGVGPTPVLLEEHR